MKTKNRFSSGNSCSHCHATLHAQTTFPTLDNTHTLTRTSHHTRTLYLLFSCVLSVLPPSSPSLPPSSHSLSPFLPFALAFRFTPFPCFPFTSPLPRIDSLHPPALPSTSLFMTTSLTHHLHTVNMLVGTTTNKWCPRWCSLKGAHHCVLTFLEGEAISGWCPSISCSLARV